MADSGLQDVSPPLPSLSEHTRALSQQLVVQLRRIGDELLSGVQVPIAQEVVTIDTDSADDQTTIASSETESEESGSSGRSTPEDIIEIRDDTNDGESSNDRQSGDNLPPVSVSAIPRHLQSHADSFSEFRSPKKRKVMSSSEDEVSDCQHTGENEESDSCPICFEQWTTSGSHRLCSLKCGHLFGQSCIDKWLKGQGGKCPQCNCKAKRQDVRVLYAKSVKALDMTERDQALEALEREKEARRKVELDAAQMRLQYQLAIGECGRLRQELEKRRAEIQLLRSRPGANYPSDDIAQSQGSKKLSGQFIIDKTIKIWDAGKCRVMAYCPSLATLVVSQPSASPLFPGFGLKKISCMDFKTTQYLTIHSKDIRDVAFNPTADDGLLLSCSLDKTVKITNILSNSVVQSYESPMPVWSCVWNSDDRNYFYSGLQNGTVLEYDIRNTSSHVNELNKEGSRSPCVSLEYICRNPDSDFRPGGVLVGQLDKISFYEKKSEDFRLHLLPLEGSLTSLNFESSTRHFLATFRPTAKHFTVRHQMCELTCTNISADPTVIDNLCSCNVVQTFHGGHTQTILSKSILLPHPEDSSRLVVCAGDESSNSVYLWDSSTGETLQKLSLGDKVVDLCSLSLNGNRFLLALSDKQLKVHKW